MSAVRKELDELKRSMQESADRAELRRLKAKQASESMDGAQLERWFADRDAREAREREQARIAKVRREHDAH